MAARPDDPQQHHAEVEQGVRERWRARDVAAESLRRRAGAPARVIWESGGIPERVLADVFARYATMRGWEVERGGGAGGDHDALGDRLGSAPTPGYRPSDPAYVESVWWAVKEIFDRGLLYEDVKVVPYCPRCATPLTSDEVAAEAVTDPAAYVRFKVARDGGPLQAGDELLVWTTAPWTLVANAAVAVDPELIYVRAKTGTLDAPVVLAESLVAEVLGDNAGVRILERFRGAAIDGLRYEAPLHYLPAGAFGERGHTVLLAGFVTATEGTGLVSIAPAFGEDDLGLGTRYGLALINPVGPGGAFDERIGRYAGRAVKESERSLLDDLRARGRLLRAGTHDHHAPHCAHCATRVLPYATASWYVATSRLLDIRARRGGDRLVSHERPRGMPLPVWRCEHGHLTVVGSFDELAERSGVRLDLPHRPHADDIAFPCACGEPATRVPARIQPWLEAGAMPFAERHEPFAGDRTLDEIYPADLVCANPADLASLRTVAALLRGGEQVAEHIARAPRVRHAHRDPRPRRRRRRALGDPRARAHGAARAAVVGVRASSRARSRSGGRRPRRARPLDRLAAQRHRCDHRRASGRIRRIRRRARDR